MRPDDRIPAADAEAFEITADACQSAGWHYRRVGDLDPVWKANLRWLAGYRHPRCQHEARRSALRAAFRQPAPLLETVRSIGDPIALLPVLYHQMWRGELIADLESAPLAGGSLVRLAEGLR